MKRDDGGPAFPEPFTYNADMGPCGTFITASSATGCGGMKLRDAFAIAALQGLVSSDAFHGPLYQQSPEVAADFAWKQADAMLAARDANTDAVSAALRGAK